MNTLFIIKHSEFQHNVTDSMVSALGDNKQGHMGYVEAILQAKKGFYKLVLHESTLPPLVTITCGK